MNIIQKISIIFLVAVIAIGGSMVGCQGPAVNKQIMNDDIIIANHIGMYMSATNSQNDDIAAILREFSLFTITNRFSTWSELSKKENQFMGRLQTSNISYFYPVIPSAEEIKISNSFLDTVIAYDTYYHTTWLYQIGQRIPTISTKFITKMNDYEYNKRTDK